MRFDWKPVTTNIRIRDAGPTCYKTYRRGGRTFWRNYGRAVPGGVSFIQRLALAQAEALTRTREYLGRAI